MKKSKRTFSSEFDANVAFEVTKEENTIIELNQIYFAHPNLISL